MTNAVPAAARRLLVMSCSDRKFAVAAARPAWALYDGNAFRVVRKYLAEVSGGVYPVPGDVYPCRALALRDLAVIIVSAKYGPVEWTAAVARYDLKMTPALAQQHRAEWGRRLREFCAAWEFRSAFFFGGESYKLAVPVTLWQPPGCSVELSSGGIGVQLGQLKRWLERGAGA